MTKETFNLTPSIQQQIIQSLLEKLIANYIFPETADQICACIQRHFNEHEYDDITEGDFFAYALTTHLQEVNQDEHLWVQYHAQALPEEEELLRLNKVWQEEQQLEARIKNYGFNKVERMPGNVGYLDIGYFYRAEWGSAIASAALTAIANTSALILDLRQCKGGYPDMVALVCSYLFEAPPVHLGSIYWKDDNTTQEFWTQAEVSGQRFGDKPIFALIGKTTFSAGEMIANALQTRQRALLIGKKTDGGAHPTTTYRLHPHFELSIPIGYSINPLTGGNWEKEGITPEISIPDDLALEVAYAMALKAVIENLGWPESRPLKLLLLEAKKALKALKG